MPGVPSPSLRACMVGTYTPRQCGIATFTADLRAALVGLDPAVATDVVTMSDPHAEHSYGDEVVFEVNEAQRSDYRAAAEFVNQGAADVVCVQHEFGIFGGPDGRHLLELVEHVRAPVVTSLHTVLADPTEGQRTTLLGVADASERVVVLAEQAVTILTDVYGIDPAKVVVIPHGVPDIGFVDPSYGKHTFGADGRTVLLTFGLISKDKGVEVVLDALPTVVAAHPDVLYVVLGATHPEVRRQDGEAYRRGLEQRVTELGLGGHVVFHDRYVSLDELCRYLGSADLYLTPYHAREQIVSGTLAYAVGMGRAVVSTPYRYAEELLDEGRGRLFPFGDSAALAAVLTDLIGDVATRNRMRRDAYHYGRAMTWPAVATRHAELFAEVVATQGDRRLRPATAWDPDEPTSVLPPLSLDHLARLTDDTGINQHATYGIPDRRHGYATDDVARALVVAVEHHARAGDQRSLGLAQTYLSFLAAAQREDGRFDNLLTFDRRTIRGSDSEDTLGQAVWGLGRAVATGPGEGVRGLAGELLERALPAVSELTHPKAMAYAMCGLSAYLERFPGALAARRALMATAGTLTALQREHGTESWHWFEPAVTYGSPKLPQAMLLAARSCDHDGWRSIGLRTLDWLLSITWQGEYFDFVGNEGWYPRGGRRAEFGQQPMEAGYTAEACMAAYEATGNTRYLDQARAAVQWLTGRNRLGVPLYDPLTGVCADGIDRHGVSRNAGAESVICCLLGLLAVPPHALSTEPGPMPPVPSTKTGPLSPT